MTSLAEELPKEIARVREVQDQFKSLRGMPNVMVEPQIQIMEREIQAATEACASGDPLLMIRSLEALRGYQS